MQLNPYVSGNPLKDQAQFFGREDIMRDVMQMLRHPEEKAIVLFGQRRIGKTTILLQLVQRLSAGGEFTPVFFDLQDQASLPLEDVLFKLAQTIAAGLGQPAPERERFDRAGEYFQKQFLAQMSAHAAPGGLVILFDEFDVMDSPQKGQAAQAFFPYLRGCLAVLEQVKFVFVIGRRPEELSTDTLSTFKGIRAARVSLLDHKATEAVVRQSEAKSSLLWSDAAVEKVWSWTQGHTYCTQLVCSAVWENLQEKNSGSTPATAQPEDVDQMIPDALKNGANAFHWIWDGLPPAERVVMAAMAEAKAETISPEEIEEILNRSGVRLVVRELKLAPATLVDWELLRPVNGGFRVTVPLLRQWVRSNRPLTRTKEELDRLDPLAENLYRSGQSFYGLNQPAEASQQLRQALTVNPNHLKSRLLLGRILLEQGKTESIQESVQILEEAYRYDSSAAGPDLVKSLLAYADQQAEEDSRVNLYARILKLQPGQPAAVERMRAINQARQQQWRSLGEQALQQGDFTRAIQAFEKAGATDRIEQVRMAEQLRWVEQGEQALAVKDFDKAEELFQLAKDDDRLKKVLQARDQQWIEQELAKAAEASMAEDWETVQAACSAVLERHPGHPAALDLMNKAQPEARLAVLYRQGIDHLAAGQAKEAQSSFVEIIAIRPGYKQSTRYLDEIVHGSYGVQFGTGARWKRILSLVLWAGLALVIEYMVYVLVVVIGQIGPLYDLTKDVSYSLFVGVVVVPCALAFLLTRWLQDEWMIRGGEVSVTGQSRHSLTAKLKSVAVDYGLPVAVLFLVYTIISRSTITAMDYASHYDLGSSFWNIPGDFLSFILFSLLPGGIAYGVVRAIQKLRNSKKKPRISGQKNVQYPEEMKIQPEEALPSAATPTRARELHGFVWIVITLAIFALSFGIFFIPLNQFYIRWFNFVIIVEIVLILLTMIPATIITFFAVRSIRRSMAKKAEKGS